MRLMVYSHDTFGLGNIRRVLAVCEHLLESISDLSILLISGSPMLHSFRIPERLDYIKLPCINRDCSGKLSPKYLGTQIDETIKLRTDLILAATINYKPDLLLVDKKPYGIKGELKPILTYIKNCLLDTKIILLLRDILDAPDVTINEWRTHNYYTAAQWIYDQLLVVGMTEIFDFCQEYQLPPSVAWKVQQCGYIRKSVPNQYINLAQLAVKKEEKLVLVTPGGGEDGYQLVDTYLSGLAKLPAQHNIKSMIVVGPEMSQLHKQQLYQAAQEYSHVQICEFTDNLTAYMSAADAIVCMGGYNTICEVLSLGKRAIAIPRVQPVAEQLIRISRMAEHNLLQMIHPDELTPEKLMRVLLDELNNSNHHSSTFIDFDALPRISKYIKMLLYNKTHSSQYISPEKSQQWLATVNL